MTRLALVAAIALPILTTACGDTPTAPVASSQQDRLYNRAFTGRKVAKYTNALPILGTTAIKVIGPGGGTIAVNGFEVRVPAGAVRFPTLFTITLPLNITEWSDVKAEFGPHGMTFAAPVTIKLPYVGTSAEGANVHVLWNNGIDWVPLPTTITNDGRIEAQTNHFSEYGTEEDPSRGITTAGG